MGTWKLDKNEYLPAWHPDLFAKFLERLSPEHLSTHPELSRLYALLAQYTQLPESQLLIGAGTDACIHAAFDALVSVGDTVVVPSPSFLMYDIYAATAGAAMRRVAYEQNFSLSADALCDAVTSDVALVCLPNPGSPIGFALPPTDQRMIVDHAARLGVPVLLDEAYYPFYPHSFLGELAHYGNVIVTRSFSKAGGLAGARIGFAAASAGLISLLRAYKPMYEITFPSVLLAELLLEEPNRLYEYAEEVRKGKLLVNEAFRKWGFDTYPGEANFILVNFGEKRDTLIAALDAAGVLYKNRFDASPLAGWSRFSLGPLDYMQRFLQFFESVCFPGK